jgi:glycosyltransferase involved in cell wall biosynthesis
MRILAAHNRYQQRGGEDAVFESETDLLRLHAHDVIKYEITNDAVNAYSRYELARATIWNPTTYDEIAALIASHRPQVAHFHNTFPLLSSSGYDACREAGVPVVQTLHNYRLLCPAATLYRSGRPCEACLHRTIKWPSLLHACYRDDRTATAATACMLAYHRARGTYRRKVNRYIALTEFAKQKFVAGGFDPESIIVKGNSSPDRGPGPGGDYALFVGRLAPEKGVATLLDAWSGAERLIDLKIVGDGPLSQSVATAAAHIGGVEHLGRRNADEVADLMKHAAFIVFPSTCYETFGLTIIEALSAGTPVLAARLGAAAELVRDGETGRLFAAGDAASLRAGVHAILRMDQERLRANARGSYEENHTPHKNLCRLVSVYESVIGEEGLHGS